MLVVVRGRDRAHGAAVEGVFHRDEARANRLSFVAEQAGMRACQLQRGLPRFGAAVTEEDAVHACDLRQLECKRGGAVMVEEVRSMQQCGGLLMDGTRDRRMTVAKCAYTNPT